MTAFYGDNFTEDGRLFNREGKTTIMEVLFCGGDLLKLAGLTIKEAWLRDDGEGYPANTQFLMTMREEFLYQNAAVICTLSAPMQEVILKVSQWLIVLYRNDQMYFERMGGCILFIITKYPEYQDDLRGILDALEGWYFLNEHRADRLTHMRAVFRELKTRYDTDQWFRTLADWCFRYIYDNREAFNWQVPSAEIPDRCVYDPLVWAGSEKGRGKEWVMVNGGNG